MLRVARTAATPSSATTRAATGTARSARAAARAWLAEREADLLPLPYYHVVFTLPSAIGAIAWQNKALVYGLLFKAASETMLTIAADPKHLGARIGMTAVLHTWGSALTHHPHVHMIVPGGGLSLDGERFVPCRGRRRRFFLPVRVLSRLFRRLMLEKLAAAYGKGLLTLKGSLAKLATPAAFAAALKPLRWKNWFVYIKEPFAGPKAVLAYLSRYTHRVAISNTRLIAHDERGVTFRYKDYRADGLARHKVMTLAHGRVHPPLHAPHPAEGLPPHPPLRAVRLRRPRRQYRAAARAAGSMPPPAQKAASPSQDEPAETVLPPCPCCGGRMTVIEFFERGTQPRYRPPSRPPSGSIRHELELAADAHNAASLYCRFPSRKAHPLPLEAGSPGNYGQTAAGSGFFSGKPDANPPHRHCSNQKSACAANGCGCRSS